MRRSSYMWIKLRYLKFVFMIPGSILLFTVFTDRSWHLLGTAILAIAIGGLLGYGVERLYLYVNHNPGGTRWSKFLIGR
jgi:hypothetical protein